MKPMLLAGPGPVLSTIRSHLAAFLLAPALALATSATAGGTQPHAASPLPVGLSVGEWSGIQQQIAASRYRAEAIPGEQALGADNAHHQFSMRFEDGGLSVAPRESSSWGLQLDTLGYGRAGQMREVGKAEPSAEANRVSYRHESLGLTEWYVNTREGVEHGYTLSEAPKGEGEVRLSIAARGLQARVDGENSIDFVDSQGQSRLGYGKLLVLDDSGKVLPATLGTQPDGSLLIAFDDRGAQYPVVVDPLLVNQIARIISTDPPGNDNFGISIAVSGDTLLVGASSDDFGPVSNNDNQGSAFVFVRNGGSWVQQAKLTASDGALADFFGTSVALSGDTAVVGTPNDDTGSNAQQGAAYVFVRSGGVWSEQAKLTLDDGAGTDSFGASVAVEGDSILVGVTGRTVTLNNQGAAYVYTRSDGVWSQQAELVASNATASALLGTAVALSGDTAVVTALPRNKAYVYTRSGSAWTEQAILTGTGVVQQDAFGFSVALSGDTVVVGAPSISVGAGSAFVFVRSGSSWSEQAKLISDAPQINSEFGYSVAVSGDGALIGARRAGTNDDGAAFYFERSGTAWSQQAKMIATTQLGFRRLGSAVALRDGVAFAGAPLDASRGAVFLFAGGPQDWGDAPDSYGTLRGSDGPYHLQGGTQLGALIDAETDGQPHSGAVGDDIAGVDDEDGLSFSTLTANASGSVTVNASAPGFVDLWLDANHSGDFFDSADLLLSGVAVTAGSNILPIPVPVTTAGSAFARMRLSGYGGLGPTGLAYDGEVEDHTVNILPCSGSGTVRFNPVSYSVAEGVGMATVTASFSGTGCAAVRWATANSTAVSPGDFSSRSGIVTWKPGETGSRTISVPVIDDVNGENAEQFRVLLSGPNPGVSLSNPRPPSSSGPATAPCSSRRTASR